MKNQTNKPTANFNGNVKVIEDFFNYNSSEESKSTLYSHLKYTVSHPENHNMANPQNRLDAHTFVELAADLVQAVDNLLPYLQQLKPPTDD